MSKITAGIKLFVLAAYFIIPFNSFAQVVVYKTYEGYQNHKGEHYDNYLGFVHLMGSVRLILERNGKQVKVHCSDIWGFHYHNELFRVDESKSQPMQVMSAGKIVYYENGIAHLHILRDQTEDGRSGIGSESYVSKDLHSDVVPVYRASKGFKRSERKTHNIRRCMSAWERIMSTAISAVASMILKKANEISLLASCI